MTRPVQPNSVGAWSCRRTGARPGSRPGQACAGRSANNFPTCPRSGGSPFRSVRRRSGPKSHRLFRKRPGQERARTGLRPEETSSRPVKSPKAQRRERRHMTGSLNPSRARHRSRRRSAPRSACRRRYAAAPRSHAVRQLAPACRSDEAVWPFMAGSVSTTSSVDALRQLDRHRNALVHLTASPSFPAADRLRRRRPRPAGTVIWS